jgi:hypothetical protein
MSRCTVCNHPQHLEIDQAILSKDFTLAVLSQKYGLHPSSLQRHKNHIEVKMSRAHRRLREIREQGSLFLLNDLLERVRRNIAAAEAQGNYNAVFRGAHVASRLIYQLGRLEGTMKLDTLHRLISSPAWTPQASLLPTDPGLMSVLHQALLDGAFAPCPEPAPEISAHDSDEIESLDLVKPFLDTGDSALEAGLATLQRLLPDLDLTLADISPEAKPEAKNYRKITEKAAANDPPDTEKYKQYQEDEPSEKNLPKNPESLPETTAPPAVSAADASFAIVAGNSASAVMPATYAPAAFSGISYYPYLSAPGTLFSRPAESLAAGSIPHPSSFVYDPYASHADISERAPLAVSTTQVPASENREPESVFFAPLASQEPEAPAIMPATDAPAVFSEFSYDPYLPAPGTADSPSFYLSFADR